MSKAISITFASLIESRDKCTSGHDCWYVNIHTGKVLTAADSFDFKAIVTVGSIVYAEELTTYTK